MHTNLATKTEPALRVSITSKPLWEECDFWVLFYKKGPIPSSQAVHGEGFAQVFHRISTHGIEDSKQLLFVDSSWKKKGLHLLLCPESDKTMEEWETWLKKLTALLTDARARSVGAYFSEAMGDDHNHKAHLLSTIVNHLCTTTYSHLTLLSQSSRIPKYLHDLTAHIKDHVTRPCTVEYRDQMPAAQLWQAS